MIHNTPTRSYVNDLGPTDQGVYDLLWPHSIVPNEVVAWATVEFEDNAHVSVHITDRARKLQTMKYVGPIERYDAIWTTALCAFCTAAKLPMAPVTFRKAVLL